MKDNEKKLSSDQSTFKGYPSFERAEDNLKYIQLANAKRKKVAAKNEVAKDSTISKNKKTDTKSSSLSSEKKALRKLVLAAKYEDQLEHKEYGYVSTSARKKLINKFMFLYHRGIKLSEKQLKYTMNFLYWHPEVVDSKHIRFLIPATAETIGYKEAIKMTNELAEVLGDTKYETPLRNYSRWLVKKSMTLKIREMRASGIGNEQIAEQLHISSAEVAVLADNNEKFIFKDADEIQR